MVRRWKQANKIMREAEAERRAAGLPEPKWHEDPVLFMFLSIPITAGIAALVVWVTSLIFDVVGAITFGIGLIVLLGATGHMLRGVGEHRKSHRLKAWGYYIGAQAYVATASVALVNGVPQFLAG